MKYSQKTLHSSPERARYGVSFVSSKGNILCRLVKIELYKIFAIINRAIKGLHCIVFIFFTRIWRSQICRPWNGYPGDIRAKLSLICPPDGSECRAATQGICTLWGSWWVFQPYTERGAYGRQYISVTSRWEWFLCFTINPIVEIRRSYSCLISSIGFPILVRWHLYIDTGPWFQYLMG